MPADSATSDFLRWLDIIPGRHWFVLGGSGLAEAIRGHYKPTRVTEFELHTGDTLPFAEGSFDVAVGRFSAPPAIGLLAEMRRVIFPSGTVGLYVAGGSAWDPEASARAAGLHAIQCAAAPAGHIFVRGAR